MKLARVEHNRWLATNYSLYKTAPMKKQEYREEYIPLNKARTPGHERHACMTTNKGLRDLYKFSIKHELTQKEVEEGKKEIVMSETEAKKLTYDNDISIMKKVFETIIELHEEEESRNAKRKRH